MLNKNRTTFEQGQGMYRFEPRLTSPSTFNFSRVLYILGVKSAAYFVIKRSAALNQPIPEYQASAFPECDAEAKRVFWDILNYAAENQQIEEPVTEEWE